MKKIFILLGITVLLLAGCTAANEPAATEAEAPSAPAALTVMTHDSFEISEETLAAFEEANNATVTFIRSGDTGSAVNAAVLAAGKPIADVFYGIDNTFLSRALEADIFEAYDSPMLENIPDKFKIDPDNRALPVDYGDVCMNYDLAYFEENDVPIPTTLEDLLDPIYFGLVVVPNPASSSPGLAFLFATIGHFGEEAYLDYWSGLAANGLKVVNDWETLYYTEFSRWGGDRPIVLSYGSSPPVEVLYAETPITEPPTGVMTADGSCYRQIEFAGILKGTENRELAEKWIDFMLSIPFQEDLPLQMFVFPVNPGAQLDQVFVDFLVEPENPILLDPERITEMREDWINDWRDTVLQWSPL